MPAAFGRAWSVFSLLLDRFYDLFFIDEEAVWNKAFRDNIDIDFIEKIMKQIESSSKNSNDLDWEIINS